MSDPLDPAQHVKPYVHESAQRAKALHFSISEIQSRMRLADPTRWTWSTRAR
jgi:hypothetical protein